MVRISRWITAFLFPAVGDTWLTSLRIGLGVQVTLYSLSLRHDWKDLLRANGKGIISRDLSEAILNVQSSLVPRLGWLVSIGSRFGLSEDVALSATWILLLGSACLLCFGFLSRGAAVTAWFLHLCAVNSESLMTYGMDYFTTIGLFYLMIAPLPDRYALDYRIWTRRPKDRHLLGFFQRVLQLHLCLIYFFSGLAKSLGVDWWNGTSIWRSLTCPPFNVMSPGHPSPFHMALTVNWNQRVRVGTWISIFHLAGKNASGLVSGDSGHASSDCVYDGSVSFFANNGRFKSGRFRGSLSPELRSR